MFRPASAERIAQGGNGMNTEQYKNQTKYLYCIINELPKAIEKFNLTEEQVMEIKIKLRQRFNIITNSC